MKKKLLSTMLLLLGCMSLSACTINVNMPGTTTEVSSNDSTKKETIQKEVEENANVLETRDLTDEEIMNFSAWIQDTENYGFALSDYSDITDCDFDQVFYCGADINSTMTDTDFAAYTEVNGEEPMTDVTKITSTDLEDFLNRKAGISIEDMKYFTLLPSPDNDCFYFERGDTNYMTYECTAGHIENGIYTVYFTRVGDEEQCEMTLKPNGDDYKVISNKIK